MYTAVIAACSSAIGYVQLLQAAAADTCTMNDQVDTNDNKNADYDNTNELTSRDISRDVR